MIRSIRLALVPLLAATACGGGNSTGPSDTLVVQGAAVTSTVSSEAPVDSAPGTSPAGTSPDDTSVAGIAKPATPRNETPLPAGLYRTDKVAGPIVPVTFALPVDGLYTMTEEGFLGVYADAAELAQLVSVIQVDNNLAFTTPTIDFAGLADAAYGASVTEPAPADLLAWLAARPGVTAGPIVESTIAGQPARSMTYSIGAFDGALPCYPDDQRACAATLFAPITGLGQVYLVGDTGTMFEVRLGGQRFAVDVSDRPRAAEIADSLQLMVEPPTGVPAGSEPVPFVGPHRAGAQYYSERSSGGVYLLRGFEGISTAESRLRTTQLRLEADGVDYSWGAACMIITDVHNSRWIGGAASAELPLVPPPMPDDLLAAIVALDGVRVVTPAFQVDLGRVTATAIDVTASSGEVAVLDRSLGVVPGLTTRFVQVPRPAGDGVDLISVAIGSPCEPVLETVQVLPSGRD
jgi:hypothetical protein